MKMEQFVVKYWHIINKLEHSRLECPSITAGALGIYNTFILYFMKISSNTKPCDKSIRQGHPNTGHPRYSITDSRRFTILYNNVYHSVDARNPAGTHCYWQMAGLLTSSSSGARSSQRFQSFIRQTQFWLQWHCWQPIKKDSQHRVMLRIPTAFPS
jgi:hypothetical protein